MIAVDFKVENKIYIKWFTVELNPQTWIQNPVLSNNLSSMNHHFCTGLWQSQVRFIVLLQWHIFRRRKLIIYWSFSRILCILEEDMNHFP